MSNTIGAGEGGLVGAGCGGEGRVYVAARVVLVLPELLADGAELLPGVIVATTSILVFEAGLNVNVSSRGIGRRVGAGVSTSSCALRADTAEATRAASISPRITFSYNKNK